jgi:oligogalacturonide lyase
MAWLYLVLLFFTASAWAQAPAAVPSQTQPPPAAPAAQEPPRSWIDPATHHRIVRLSDEPGTSSLYFHQNAYTAKGDLLLVTTRGGLSVINLQTHNIRSVVEGPARNVIVGRKTRQVFYLKGDTAYATDLDSGETRAIATDPKLRTGSGFAVNADDTLLAGSWVEQPQGAQANASTPNAAPSQLPRDRGDNYPGKGDMMERRLAAKIPMSLYTIDIKTGKINTFNHSTDWLNHVQFSPTDPSLIMFCHEGPWHKVDRIWTIRTDGTGLRQIHHRKMEMEIAGHEFFSPDGKTIWYDLQTPKYEQFWLAGFDLASGETKKYKLECSQWSVHYNEAPDEKRFSGDGGGPNSVARTCHGQWIYLFTPEGDHFQVEKLVDLSKHDYRLEPNATFAPDGKWIVFRSNMFGPTHVYAVEVQKTE